MPETKTDSNRPERINFDGWQIAWQLGPDTMYLADIEEIDTDHQDAPTCETEHQFARDARYAVTSPSDQQMLCQVCVEDLHRNANTRPDYVMGRPLS